MIPGRVREPTLSNWCCRRTRQCRKLFTKSSLWHLCNLTRTHVTRFLSEYLQPTSRLAPSFPDPRFDVQITSYRHSILYFSLQLSDSKLKSTRGINCQGRKKQIARRKKTHGSYLLVKVWKESPIRKSLRLAAYNTGATTALNDCLFVH